MNIAGVVDVPEVVRFASQLKSVSHVEETLFACSTDAARKISGTIRQLGLNRVVVAACTPRTHEPVFQDTLREAGINKYAFVMANIREHSAWVHSREKEKATEKAKDKIRMAVARAALLRPLKEVQVGVTKSALVLGGGVAGMTSALNLAGQGFPVHLVEQGEELGGEARWVHRTIEGLEVQPFVVQLIDKVRREPLIHLHTRTTVAGARGYVGNFVTNLAGPGGSREVEHGVSIIATGARENTTGEYCYGQSERVLTLLELEQRIAASDPALLELKTLAVILCVGSREPARPHCSRICCGQAIKCILSLKRVNPGLLVYVLFRDMRAYGLLEDYYREASKAGVVFIQYGPDAKPEVEVSSGEGGGSIQVRVHDRVLGKQVAIPADMLGLAVGVVPRADSLEVSKLFKVALSQDGFFLEAHMKLRPVDFATEGVFLAGSAHFPKTLAEATSHASAASGRAATVLARDSIPCSGAVCEVDAGRCTGCGLCAKICQYGAVEVSEAAETGKKAFITAALCQGCGACSSVCPTEAVFMNHFTDPQLTAEIGAAFEPPVKRKGFEPRILTFLCNWCGYAGSDMAGVSRMQYAPNGREVRVMCTSRIKVRLVLEPFLRGADGVLICGCHLGDCHYGSANLQTEEIVRRSREILQGLGIDPERLRHEYISAAEGAKYAQAVNDFTSFLKGAGPSRLEPETVQALIAKRDGAAKRTKGKRSKKA